MKPLLFLSLFVAFSPSAQNRDRPSISNSQGDQTGSLRGLGAFRIVVDRRVSAASTIASSDDVRAQASRRFADLKLELAESTESPERRKPLATFKLQVESVEVDGRAGNMIVGKLLVPSVSPNDPNGPGSSVLLWEMRRLWIGPEEKANQRMRENVDLIVDSFAADYAKDNPR